MEKNKKTQPNVVEFV